jgi:hypothetical protein
MKPPIHVRTRYLPAQAAPIACTLDEPARALRNAEWSELRWARTAEHRTATTLTTAWRRDEGVQREVERLVAAEHACCPFFGFDLTISDDAVTLVTSFPEGLSPNGWAW